MGEAAISTRNCKGNLGLNAPALIARFLLVLTYEKLHANVIAIEYLRGDSLELRRLKPDPLNLSVNTGAGKQTEYE